MWMAWRHFERRSRCGQSQAGGPASRASGEVEKIGASSYLPEA
jgi:hypothetical protein